MSNTIGIRIGLLFAMLFAFSNLAFAEDISHSINYYPYEQTYAYKVTNIYEGNRTYSLEGTMVNSDAKLCQLNGANCSIIIDIDEGQSVQLVIKTLVYENNNVSSDAIILNTGSDQIQYNIYYVYGIANEDHLFKMAKWISEKIGQPINKIESAIKIIIILLALYGLARIFKIL